MIVGKSKHFPNLLVTHHLFEDINPILQITRAVDDRLVPRRGLLLNPFAVSKPSNISEVRRN